ncbi:MAG TPA: recombinase family protein [Ferruginibacter sp.]|jgi:DNA invertase Pin-like site-specific DNA recombinase|nr:recombinase family protein [Ferruginibacter sp.]
MYYYYYSRISTVSQSSSRQIENFKNHGHVTSKNIFVDKVQGNISFFERPEAVKLYDTVTAIKDNQVTIVVDSIDRLGRNLIDILKTIEIFTKNQINLKSLKEGFETLIDGKENPMARLVCAVMGSIAELERNKIKERTSEGILLAKAQGKFKGRVVGSYQSREKLFAKYPIIVMKLKKKMEIRDICRVTGHSSTTIIKVKKAMGI